VQDKARLRRLAAEHGDEISLLLRTVPRDLLLLLKTNDCLRSLETRLSAPLNTVAITARACARARAAFEARDAPVRGRLRGWAERAAVEARLALLVAAVWLARRRGQAAPG
jgi:aarF domain-containing kinase